MTRRKKLLLNVSLIFLISISVVNSQSISPPPLGITEGITNFNNLGSKTECSPNLQKCGGCLKDCKCYNIGARLTIKPEYPKRDLAWINETYLYCGEDETRFVPQKVTGETCENDFECQSNKCIGRKCEQKNNIIITEIYNDKNTLIKNLLFRDKELFYFKGLDNKNYSIGFGKNDSDFVFFTNKDFFSYQDKIFILNNNSQFIFNSIIFSGDIIKANLTFIESKNSINDPERLIEKLTCDGLFVNGECKKEGELLEIEEKKYIIENKSLKEIPNEETLTTITGRVIKTERNFISRFLEKIKQFFKKFIE